jgi:hypothetical protein
LLILFDKNVPDRLDRFLIGHQVRTSTKQGWDLLRNGVLLKTAEDAGFDVLVIADQNIKYQQNLTGRRIAIIVLGSNAWPVLKRRGSEIADLVDAAAPGSYEFMEFPRGISVTNTVRQNSSALILFRYRTKAVTGENGLTVWADQKIQKSPRQLPVGAGCYQPGLLQNRFVPVVRNYLGISALE